MRVVQTSPVLDQIRSYFRQMNSLYGSELLLENRASLKKMADTPASLDVYYQTIKNCHACSLARNRANLVFGTGQKKAKLMLIGEAPGEEEDKRGEPFVGKAGQLLDRILAAIQFDRQEVYITNILKCRPPENRDPGPDEILTCKPHLEKQIALINPSIILVLGRVAAHNLLGLSDPMTKMRGQTYLYRDIPVIVTYHPAALLRNPEWKRPTWSDVQRVRLLYDKRVGDKPKWKPQK